MNETMTATHSKAIGAPNSVARYLSENSFGENKFVFLERVKGDLVLRAAQTTLAGAEHYMQPGRELVDVDNCHIIRHDRKNLVLGTGRIVAHRPEANGSTFAFIADAPHSEMTEPEWEEYCARIKETY